MRKKRGNGKDRREIYKMDIGGRYEDTKVLGEERDAKG